MLWWGMQGDAHFTQAKQERSYVVPLRMYSAGPITCHSLQLTKVMSTCQGPLKVGLP